jgi:hypothetical protein
MLMQKIWTQPRVVAEMVGSLPMGGSVENTPIHAFSETPIALKFDAQSALNPVKTDIDLGGSLAFTIDNVVTPGEAQAIIEASEIFGYKDEAPGISTPPGMRMNKSVHWVSDEQMLGPVFKRIQALLPQEMEGWTLFNQLSHRINMYRYDKNDIFNRHIDGDWPGYSLNEDRTRMLQWSDARSFLTMILYLNDDKDGVIGGHTRLLNKHNEWIDVKPKKGSALFFRHGFNPQSVIHIGDRVSSNQSKYVARINVMYQKS